MPHIWLHCWLVGKLSVIHAQSSITLDLLLLTDPSTKIVHRSCSSFATFPRVNSSRKIVMAYALFVAVGTYLMSSSLNSIAHFVSLLDMLGLCSICNKG